MCYKAALKNAICYDFKKGDIPTENMYKNVFNNNRLSFCFYAYEDETDIYCKVRHRFEYFSEDYNEYGDSNLSSNMSNVILTFKVNSNDKIVFDEIYDPTFEEIKDFITELSVLFKVRYLFLSIDNTAIGYIENGECYKYEAVKV
ncbi:hypothetical protein ACV3Q3_12915 [Clostridium perfringens]